MQVIKISGIYDLELKDRRIYLSTITSDIMISEVYLDTSLLNSHLKYYPNRTISYKDKDKTMPTSKMFPTYINILRDISKENKDNEDIKTR